MKPTLVLGVCAALAASLAAGTACEKKQPSVKAAPSGVTKGSGAPSEHKDTGAGHGGAIIQLGVLTVGPFEVKATRDEGQIIAGKDAPIDVTVTPSAGSTTRATAVRFWIGTEDAKDSVKAKADIEDPDDPHRWHTHADVPDPIPAGSKLWVEIEDDKGGRAVASFDLKA